MTERFEWREATTFEEVRDALREGKIVKDPDGDIVVSMDPDSRTYRYMSDNDVESHTAASTSRFRILKMDEEEAEAEVDPAEVQQAIASITGAAPDPDPFATAVRRKVGARPDADVSVIVEGGKEVQIGDYTWDSDPYTFEIHVHSVGFSMEFDNLPDIWRWLLT